MITRLALAWCALSVPASLLVGAFLARLARPVIDTPPPAARPS